MDSTILISYSEWWGIVTQVVKDKDLTKSEGKRRVLDEYL